LSGLRPIFAVKPEWWVRCDMFCFFCGDLPQSVQIIDLSRIVSNAFNLIRVLEREIEYKPRLVDEVGA